MSDTTDPIATESGAAEVAPPSPTVERAHRLAQAALDRKAEDVVVLDVRGLTSFADAFVLATGTSDRHVASVAEAVIQASKREGEVPLGVEGQDEGRWVLIDGNDVIVHVFQADVREHYDLDRLWEDAKRTEVRAPEDAAAAAGE